MSLIACCWLAGSKGEARTRAYIPGPVPITVEADQVTVQALTGGWRATGSVDVRRGDDTLRAHEAEFAPATDELRAAGGPTCARVRGRLAGKTPVTLEADRLVRGADGGVRATGSVQATTAEAVLQADRIDYDPGTGEIRAEGGQTQPRVSFRMAEGTPVAVEAAQVARTEAGLIEARGDVVATRDDDTLRAGQVTYNPDTGEMAASGNVVLTGPRGRVAGEHVLYNVRTRSVSGDQVAVAVPSPKPETEVTYHLWGQRVTAAQKGEGTTGGLGEIRLERGRLSTCAAAHPHFSLDARELVLRPGDRVIGRGVGLSLLGMRLFSLPRVAVNLSDDREAPNLFPRLSFSRTDGAGLRSDWRSSLPLGGAASGYAVLSLRHTLRGGVGIDHFGAVPLGLRAGLKEDASSRFVSGLTLSVFPALTFYVPASWGPRGALQVGLDRMPASQRVYSGDIVGGGWSGDRRYRLIASGCAGRFTEHPTDVTADRLSFSGALEVRPFRVLPQVEAEGAVRARVGLYSTGTRYGVVTPEVGLNWISSPRDTWHLEWRHHIARGTTPFYFDRVDAARSLLVEWRHRTARRALRVKAEMDVNTGEVFSWEVGYSRRLECLQPGIVVGRHGGSVGVGLTLEIPGLSGGF